MTHTLPNRHVITEADVEAFSDHGDFLARHIGRRFAAAVNSDVDDVLRNHADLLNDEQFKRVTYINPLLSLHFNYERYRKVMSYEKFKKQKAAKRSKYNSDHPFEGDFILYGLCIAWFVGWFIILIHSINDLIGRPISHLLKWLGIWS